MAKVTYAPLTDVGDNGETRQAGYTFKKGQSVEVAEGPILEKMKANPHFKVTGAKAEAAPKKDDRTPDEVDPFKNAPSIANMVYPTQPPGVGSKTAAIPRPEGSFEAAIEAAGGDMKLAAENAQKTADATKANADKLAKAQQASDKTKPTPRKSASKSKSKSKSKR